MKKVYFLGALAGLMMVSCANDEIVNSKNHVIYGEAPMAFNVGVRNMSRDGETPYQDDFDSFGVWAVKANADADVTGATWSSSELVVMNNYKVEYVNNEWVYEGINDQFLKYWDGSYANTYFFAYGPYGINATFDNTQPSITFPDVEMSTELADAFVYSNAQVEDNAKHVNPVTAGTVPLTFNRVLSQVRLAIYEAIPGYSVELINVEFADGTTAGIAAIPANFDGTDWERGAIVTKGEATVNYSGANFGNTPALSYANADTDPNNLNFEIPTGDIKTSYADATQIPTTYYVLPNNGALIAGATANSGLQFVMSYQLKSDDTNEVITVKGARVYVQHEWTAWEPNTVYTYVFRITTASSGTTEDKDPKNDPEEPGQALYPIVFDNIVIAKIENGVVEKEWDVNPENGVTNPHNPTIHD